MSSSDKSEAMKSDKTPSGVGKSGKVCPSCGLPITDPLWFACPRCRTILSQCDGCAACGKCGKCGKEGGIK